MKSGEPKDVVAAAAPAVAASGDCGVVWTPSGGCTSRTHQIIRSKTSQLASQSCIQFNQLRC